MRKIVSGIYQIVNTQNGHKYIGSSKDIHKRILSHFEHLRKGKHHSIYLQRSYNLHGENVFDHSILEICSLENLVKREQYYIDTLSPEYNICPTAYSMHGLKKTPEQIARMAESLRGVKHTEERNQRKSEYMKEVWQNVRKGWTHSEKTKKLVGEKGIGRVPTDEARKNMAEAARLAWAEGRRKGETHKNKRKSQKNCEETARDGE